MDKLLDIFDDDSLSESELIQWKKKVSDKLIHQAYFITYHESKHFGLLSSNSFRRSI